MLKILKDISAELVAGSVTTSPFLPQVINAEELRVVLDVHRGFHVLFVNSDMLAQAAPFTPYWGLPCRDHATMEALARWAVVRRNLWQEWADMVEREGHAALDEHLHRLLGEEPALHATATELRVSPDRPEIILSEWLESADTSRVEEVARHRFASRAALDRFMAWFYRGKNCDTAWSLVQIAFSDGTHTLGKILDELAEQKPEGRQQRRHQARRSAS